MVTAFSDCFKEMYVKSIVRTLDSQTKPDSQIALTRDILSEHMQVKEMRQDDLRALVTCFKRYPTVWAYLDKDLTLHVQKVTHSHRRTLQDVLQGIALARHRRS